MKQSQWMIPKDDAYLGYYDDYFDKDDFTEYEDEDGLVYIPLGEIKMMVTEERLSVLTSNAECRMFNTDNMRVLNIMSMINKRIAVMSHLSDAQECLSNAPIHAKRHITIAKLILLDPIPLDQPMPEQLINKLINEHYLKTKEENKNEK